jgi:biopolymer transport protein ExbB
MLRLRSYRKAHVSRAVWLRWLIMAAALFGMSAIGRQSAVFPLAVAQEEKNPSLGPELSPQPPSGTAPNGRSAVKERTLMDSIRAGGYIGVIIILMSIVAVAFVIEHSLSIRKQRLMPEEQLVPLEEMIARGEIDPAIQFCEAPQNYSLATDVILAGLERYKGSEFGFADYKSAVEEAGEDHTARLYRKTDGLNIIGVIAPMLGLFGTVEGMMESFNIIASQEGAAQPYQLADSISKALVTTWLGLVVAIPSMVAFSYFRNKIDSLVSECGKRVERILTPLSRRR